MHSEKPVDGGLLTKELEAAGIPTPYGVAVAPNPDLGGYDVTTFEAGATGLGEPVDLPPEARPVLDAHTAPPPFVRYVGTAEQRSIVRTTDAALHELVRIATALKHVYVASVAVSAVDAGDGTTKATEARLTFKRTPSGLAQVGSTVALWTTQDAAASAWAIVAAPSGTDLQIGVRGAAGRTIDWAATVTVAEHAPEGL